MSDGFPEGWYDDPTGRHQRRYYDGSWTDHVADGSEVLIDPINPTPDAAGPPSMAVSETAFDDEVTVSRSSLADNQVRAEPADSLLAPPSTAEQSVTNEPMATAAPTSANSATAAHADGNVGADAGPGFLDSLGPDAGTRPEPDLPSALGGIGGLFVGGGFVGLLGNSGNQAAVVIGGLIAFGGALALMLLVVDKLPFLRSPAVSCAAVGIFAVVAGLLAGGDTIGDDVGSQVLLLAGIGCLTAWAVPGFRGRPFLLGVGLVSVSLGLAGLVTGGGDSCNSFDSFGCNDAERAAGAVGLSSGSGILLAIIGCGLLLVVRKLDASGKTGLATTVAAVCIIDLVVGAFGLAVDLGEAGGALLVAVAGLALGVVGHVGKRRGLTWTGATLAGGGAAAGVLFGVEPSDATTTAIFVILTGVLIAGAPRLVELVRANNADNGVSIDNTPTT